MPGGNYMAWTEAMLSELHRHLRRNLRVQSLGSFDSAGVRETYRRYTLMPGNDLPQMRRCLDLGASLEVCRGAVEPRHSGPFQLWAADREGTLLHDILFAPFFVGAAGPGQIWNWDGYVAANDLWRQSSEFADARNLRRSELERGERQHLLSGLSIAVPGRRARDPWQGKWRQVAGKSGRILLPAFRRSLILRVMCGAQ